jgi:hypothetical protein
MPIHQNEVLKRLGAGSWAEAYNLDPAEIVSRIDAMEELPFNDSDLLLAVVELRAAADLDAGTKRLLTWTKWLFGVAAGTLAAALVTLIVAA